MTEVVIQSGLKLYPGNYGSGGAARGVDQEQYEKRAFSMQDHVLFGGGDLTYSGASRDVTIAALSAFIAGRQVLNSGTGDSSFTFTIPVSSTWYIFLTYDSKLVRRDVATETPGADMLLYTITTDATGVTAVVDNRKYAPVSEWGLRDDQFLHLSTDRSKKVRYNSSGGYIEVTGNTGFIGDVSLLGGKELHFFDADGSNYVGFKAPALAANKVWTLPTADGSNGQALVTDGTGALSWANAGAPVDATYITLGTNGSLTGERVLTAGSGLTLTDGGANGPVTLDVGAGTGITVAADTVAVDQAFSPSWTGTHDYSTGVLKLPRGTTPAQTAEGSVFWDTDDDLLTIGTASGRKTMVDTNSTQTISGKTLTTPTITDFTNAVHTHASAVQGGLIAHSALSGLASGDDHTQYVHLSTARTITAQHSFSPASAQAPFLLGANAQGQKVIGLNADLLDGKNPDTTAAVDTIALRDSSGRVFATAGDTPNAAIVNGQAAAGDLSGTYPNPTLGSAYSAVDASVATPVGSILAQGPIYGRNEGTNPNVLCLPGYIARPHVTGTAGTVIALNGEIHYTSSYGDVGNGMPKGIKAFYKGFYKARSATANDNTYEPFALGVAVAGVYTYYLGLNTESSRDDIATAAVVIDTNNKIKSYNCAASGDASYTDSGFVADTTAGFQWELIVEIPESATRDSDIKVTIKVADSSGVLRTILNAVNMVSTAQASNYNVRACLMMNQDAVVTKAVYKMEKAA